MFNSVCQAKHFCWFVTSILTYHQYLKKKSKQGTRTSLQPVGRYRNCIFKWFLNLNFYQNRMANKIIVIKCLVGIEYLCFPTIFFYSCLKTKFVFNYILLLHTHSCVDYTKCVSNFKELQVVVGYVASKFKCLYF